MPKAATIYEALGGTGVLRAATHSLDDFRGCIRDGLPYSALEAIMSTFQLEREHVSSALHLPLRTLTRRKREQRLNPDESDRLFRLARIAAQAVEVLGSQEKAASWLRQPNRALSNQNPVDLLDTDAGVRQLEEILGRIEFGVFS